MNEADTRAEYIDPAIKAVGWGVVEESRIRREIALPDLATQEQITKTMESFREETQLHKPLYIQKFAALDELKKSLLHQAFSGQL